MTLGCYRQCGVVTGNGRNNWATSLNCRPIRPSANGMKWNMEHISWSQSIRGFTYATRALFSATCSYAARIFARAEREDEVGRVNSAELNYIELTMGLRGWASLNYPSWESHTLGESLSFQLTGCGRWRWTSFSRVCGMITVTLLRESDAKIFPFCPRVSSRLSIRYWLWMQVLITRVCRSKTGLSSLWRYTFNFSRKQRIIWN